jgi:hypothetical protein
MADSWDKKKKRAINEKWRHFPWMEEREQRYAPFYANRWIPLL